LERDGGSKTLRRLRERAEAALQDNDVHPVELDAHDLGTLSHELDVYHAELEIQNQELRGAQEALETSRDRYLQIFELAPIGYFRLDRSGTILEVNRAGAERFGSERSHINGQQLVSYVHSGFRGAFHTHMAKVLAHNGRETCEVEFRLADGSQFYGLVRSTGLIASAGIEPGVLVAILDVTARREAEESLRTSEQRYRALFEGSRDAIVLFDAATGMVLDANVAALKLLDLPRGRILGLQREALFPEHVRVRQELLVREQLASGRSSPLELLFVRYNGNNVPTEVTIAEVHLGLRRVLQFVLRDITERKRAEEEHARIMAQLHQSQKLEAIGRLAGGVAHDMNNLLAIIMSLASVLREELDDETKRSDLDDILAAAVRGRELTRNLLGFARKEPARRDVFSMNDTVAEVAQLLERALPKSIALRLLLASDLATVEGDAGQMHQAIMNLCVNSMDAMPHGGRMTLTTDNVTLTANDLAHEASLVAGSYVRVRVIDTGEGISRDTIPRVFEPFFTTKPPGKGTGLGLSMVYGAVQAHGGRTQLESEVGRGTTVILDLPVSCGQTRALPEAPAKKLEGSRRYTGTVLVVDDEELVRTAMGRMLAKLGFEVETAATGHDALELFREHHDRFTLVICDLSMPNMDGTEVVRRLRAIDPTVRILLASGYSDGPVDDQARSLGAIGFLAKPYSLDEVKREIDRIDR
jgi:PAS domain S-box-containing protein